MRLSLLATLALLPCYGTFAQLPPQVSPDYSAYVQPLYDTGVEITATAAAHGSMASDGAGNHYVAPAGDGSIAHYLFDNRGNVIHSTTFASNAERPCITARDGRVHVVLRETNLNRIQLWRSTNGGTAWTNVDFRSVSGTLNGLDSFEDERGVHLVYSSDEGIFYHHRTRDLDIWSTYSSTVYGSSASNAQPTITTSTMAQGDSAHVLALQGMFSFKFPSQGSGSWVASALPYADPNQSSFVVSPTGSDLIPYMFTVYVSGTGSEFSRADRRYDSQDAWTTRGSISYPSNGGSYTVTCPSYPNGGEYPYVLMNDVVPGIGRPRVYTYRLLPLPALPTPIDWTHVSGQTYRPSSRGRIASHQGSLAVLFYDQTNQTLFYRRKPQPIVGDMNENYVLTDTNWVVGTCVLASGKELRLKSGSITYIVGDYNYSGVREGGKLVLGEGASLVVEPEAKFILQPPQTGVSYVHGGRIECGAGSTILVEGGGIVEAYEGSKLYFGPGSALVVNGTFSAYGTASKKVVLTRTGTEDTWVGIDASDAEELPALMLSHVNISYCDVAVDLHTAATLTMDNCFATNVGTGLHIGPSELSPGDQPSYQFVVTNSQFTNVTGIGIDVSNTSSLLVTDNSFVCGEPYEGVGIQLNASSPLILRNQIESFAIGVWCVNGSSPELENNLDGGFNEITANYIGVQCENESHAVLGFLSGHQWDEGGQNNIHANDAFDVVLSDKSIVLAEYNSWNEDYDPPGTFSIEDESELDYDPWLPPQQRMVNPKAGTPNSALSRFSNAMRRALSARCARDYGQAAELLMTLVADRSADAWAKRWALSQLLVIAQKTTLPGLSSYVAEVQNRESSLRRHIDALLPAIYLSERSWTSALTAFESNLQWYPETSLERDALYGKFLHALYRSKDLALASQFSGLLQSRFPEGAQSRSAKLLLDSRIKRSGNPRPSAMRFAIPEGKMANGLVPAQFNIGQNYPNPFNPVTKIEYQLPASGHVTLKVFDLLGGEVATLVDEVQVAGFKNVQFDASGLSSGVYFYRLQAGEFVATRKMVVMK